MDKLDITYMSTRYIPVACKQRYIEGDLKFLSPLVVQEWYHKKL